MLEIQNVILEMVAKGNSLDTIARRLCAEIERFAPGIVCSVLTVEPGNILHTLAAPRLPASYLAGIEGLQVGPSSGACGTAAYLGEPVTILDIENDPRWGDKSLRPPGAQACWSSPIFNSRGEVIGTFAFYYGEMRGPTTIERRLVHTCVHVCSIAIEHDRWQRDQERRAYIDALTELPNRAAFNRALSGLSCDVPGAWGIFIVDLDNLKAVNDTFGHSIGDALLKVVAKRIATLTAPDRAFRIGGDEFAVLIGSAERLEDIDATATYLLEQMAVPATCDGHSVIPRATIGGAVLSTGDMAPERVRQNADFALYHAKETGRGGFVRYWPGIGTRIIHRLSSIRDVDAALREDRIDAFYQPIVRLDTREVVGFEALARMRLGQQILPAAMFRDAMTDAHIATELTTRMLAIVAADARRWLAAGLSFEHIAINVSSTDFHGGQLADRIAAAFSRERVPLDRVVVEVTETVYMDRGDPLVGQTIQQIREKGLRVALDDFGTGYASLTHLLTGPVDIIKIDRSFIEHIPENVANKVIVEGLLRIATGLNIQVVAEGIETEEQLLELQANGCGLGQGYLFSHAVNRDTATKLLRDGCGQSRASRAEMV